MDASPISPDNKAVFDKIADYVTSVDFNEAQYQLIDRHKDVFTDDEENKIEYTTIFEEYVQILENTIDTRLYESFSQDQVQQFYLNFSTNHKEYQKINPDTVEVLFGFIDFNRFKKLVLDIKKGEIQVKGVTNDQLQRVPKGEQFFWDLYNEDVNDKSIGWQKKMDHKGNIEFVSWQRAKDANGDVIGRSEVLYKGIKLQTLMARFKNFDKYNEKKEHVLEQKILERNDDGMPQKVYSRFKMPLMSERESLMKMKLEKLTGEHEGKAIFFIHSDEDPAHPIKKDVIRIYMFNGTMFWEDGDNCRALSFNTFNMGGYFPMRIMNMAFGSMMKKRMEKDYNDLLEVQKELESSDTTKSE